MCQTICIKRECIFLSTKVFNTCFLIYWPCDRTVCNDIRDYNSLLMAQENNNDTKINVFVNWYESFFAALCVMTSSSKSSPSIKKLRLTILPFRGWGGLQLSATGCWTPSSFLVNRRNCAI